MANCSSSDVLEDAGYGRENVLAQNNIGARPCSAISNTVLQNLAYDHTIACALGRLQLEVSLSFFPHAVEVMRVACTAGCSGGIIAREARMFGPKKRQKRLVGGGGGGEVLLSGRLEYERAGTTQGGLAVCRMVGHWRGDSKTLPRCMRQGRRNLHPEL